MVAPAKLSLLKFGPSFFIVIDMAFDPISHEQLIDIYFSSAGAIGGGGREQ